MKIKLKHAILEAYIFTGGEVTSGLPKIWIKTGDFDFSPDGEVVIVPNVEGNQVAKKGDYVVKGFNGRFFVVKEELFDVLYEKV
jgi:hypothetical protein